MVSCTSPTLSPHRICKVCVSIASLLLRSNHHIDAIHIDGSSYVSASTTVEYAQISPECRLRKVLPSEIDNFAFVGLTGNNDMNCSVPSVINSEYESLVDVMNLSNL